ncbi:hypothetical protein [Tenacibaculum aiptasiae]|uniref:hypothetical protein n=1 Tax=Tenacibaculum aiptasiae TaxID=426481 RepID=UPI00232C1F71|nr:hypothetical protein [Tenacibaculum aiptasiae]
MKKVIILLFIFSIQSSIAQEVITTKAKIKGKVVNSNTGMLIVKTKKEVLAVNPENKTVAWKNKELKKVDMDSYKEIPFTPIVIFEKDPLISSKLLSNAFGTKGVSRIILNSINGKILFNSEKHGFKAVNKTLLIPEQDAILVNGLKKKKVVLALYNYDNGKLIWENDLTKSGFFKAVKEAFLDTEKIMLDKHGDIFWLHNKQLLKINKLTGKIVFHQKDVNTIEMNREKDVVFVFTDKIALKKLNEETAIFAKHTNSMEPVWEAPIKVVGNIKNTIVDNEKMVVITSKGFNVIDSLGEKQWEKPELLPLIRKIVPIEKGYLVVQEKELNFVNTKGKKQWNKSVRISLMPNENPIHLFNEGNKVLYITPSKANIIDLSTGKALDKEIALNDEGFIVRNLRLKKHFFRIWYDQKKQQFPVYNENELYVFNINDSLPKSSFKFNFKGQIPDLDIREKGYFMHCDNKFYLFDFKGNLIYEREYPSNQHRSFFEKAFGLVQDGLGVYTAAIGFVGSQLNQTFKNVLVTKDLGFLSTMASDVYGTYQSYEGTLGKLTKLNVMDFNSSLMQIFSRYKKGQENNNSLLVTVANDKDDTKKIIRLFVDSGDEKLVTKLNEDQDDFIIDQIENRIFFFTKKTITIEKLN